MHFYFYSLEFSDPTADNKSAGWEELYVLDFLHCVVLQQHSILTLLIGILTCHHLSEGGNCMQFLPIVVGALKANAMGSHFEKPLYLLGLSCILSCISCHC